MLWLTVQLLIVAALAGWGIAAYLLRRADLSAFDEPAWPDEVTRSRPSPQHAEIVRRIEAYRRTVDRAPRRRRLAVSRQAFEMLNPVQREGVRIAPARVGEMDAEWVMAGNADPARRLLYIHGGAFSIGSPRSHRALTTRLAEVSGCALLVIDYRLMPEHPRSACIEDCKAAWRWMAVNGPDGPSPPRALFVAGDSAGGNLALMLIAWARHSGDVARPDAAIALSPLTDSTFGSPSLGRNVDTDVMLGRMFRVLTRIPRSVLFWASWLFTRRSPLDPEISPALGGLDGLPPVLVQASSAECLLDDARRYVNKARAAGSPAYLQTWPHMVHVWPAFSADLPETEEAFERMGEFLASARAVALTETP